MNKSSFFLLLTFLIYNHLAAQHQNVQFSHGGCTFKATLSIPPGNGPFPAIVMIPGSGQNDRNGTIAMQGGNVACLYPDLMGTTLTPYRDLGDQLTDSGYTVLRYDELFISCPNYNGQINFENVWLPALSALDYLKTRNDIDTNKLILIGHSEGAMLIPHIARNRTDVKAIISLAGARTPLDSIMARQITDIADSCNGNTQQAQADASAILNYFTMIRNKTYNASTPSFGGVRPAVWNEYMNIADSIAHLYDMTGLPTLFVGCELDFNVPPSELVRFQNETTGGHDFYTMAGLNHFMTPNNHPSVPKSMGDTIVYWLRNSNLSSNTPIPPDLHIDVFPNPFSSDIMVNTNVQNPIISISLFDMNGRVVFENAKPSRETVHLTHEVSELKPGVYILNINAKNGSINRKIVKQ
jgi:dienelactone hydrolase